MNSFKIYRNANEYKVFDRSFIAADKNMCPNFKFGLKIEIVDEFMHVQDSQEIQDLKKNLNKLEKQFSDLKKQDKRNRKRLRDLKKELRNSKKRKTEDFSQFEKFHRKLDKEFTSSEECEFCYGPSYRPKTMNLNCGCFACKDCFLERGDRIDKNLCNGCLAPITTSRSGSIYRD